MWIFHDDPIHTDDPILSSRLRSSGLLSEPRRAEPAGGAVPEAFGVAVTGTMNPFATKLGKMMCFHVSSVFSI